MSYIIIILAVLALYHFVYSGIILPSYRLKLRNELFRIRDQVRELKIEHQDDVCPQALNILHDSVTFALNRLPQINWSTRVSFNRKMIADPELKKAVEYRRNILRECSSRELQVLREDLNRILAKAFVANMGGWLVYLVPIAILLFSISGLMNFVKSIMVAPENKLAGIGLEAQPALS